MNIAADLRHSTEGAEFESRTQQGVCVHTGDEKSRELSQREEKRAEKLGHSGLRRLKKNRTVLVFDRVVADRKGYKRQRLVIPYGCHNNSHGLGDLE